MTRTPHNTFAIRAVYEPAGVSEPRYVWDGDWPLAPWLVHGHEELYASVDHMDEQFQYFVEHGPQALAVTNIRATSGHVVLVSGPRGTGKTSLIHRCVAHLAGEIRKVRGQREPAEAELWTMRRGTDGVSVVLLGDVQNQGDGICRNNDGQYAPIADINARIFDQVKRGLTRVESFASLAALPEYADLDSTDLWRAYGALGNVLIRMAHCVLVVVPDLRWRDQNLGNDFLRACSSSVKAGMVFFVESSNSQLAQDIEDEFGDIRKGTNITHLTVGKLSEEDCERFVRRRTAAPGLPSPRVAVAEEAVGGHPPHRRCQTVRDLQDMYYSASQEVIKAQQREISLDHLRRYQERRGLDLGDLGR